MAVNPFKPTAGKMPPILIGRHSIIEDFSEALTNGVGAPGRIMLVTGQRGFGKTVMLTEFRRIAKAQHWEVIGETASAGLVTRLIAALSPSGLRLDQANISPSIGISGIATASLGQAHFSAESNPLTLRNALNKRLGSKKLGKGKGILITIDETQAASHDVWLPLLQPCSTSLRMPMKVIRLMRIRRALPSYLPACRIWSTICWITR